MNCAVCSFDNTPAPGGQAPTHCEGCGTRIGGGDKPFPGIRVDPDGHPEHDRTDPVIVDDELRDQFPHSDVDDVLVIIKATYHWGRGIGMEPDGYMTDERVTVQKTDEPCKQCGNDEIRASYSQDGAGIAGAYTATCTRCDFVRTKENWA